MTRLQYVWALNFVDYQQGAELEFFNELITLLNYKGVAALGLDRVCSSHLYDTFSNWNFKKDCDCFSKWFARNLTSGEATCTCPLLFAYFLNYACIYLINVGKAIRKANNRLNLKKKKCLHCLVVDSRNENYRLVDDALTDNCAKLETDL